MKLAGTKDIARPFVKRYHKQVVFDAISELLVSVAVAPSLDLLLQARRFAWIQTDDDLGAVEAVARAQRLRQREHDLLLIVLQR